MMNKNKKIISITSIVIICIIIVVSAFFIYRNHNINSMVDKGISYIDNKDYEKAITTFDLVLEEKSNDEKAIDLKNMINTYLEAKKLYDNNELEKANSKINKVNDYESYKGFKEDVDSLKKDITDSITKLKNIDEDISKIRILIDNKKFNEAKNSIDKLEKEKLNDNQKQQLSDLKSRVNSELERQNAEKKLKEIEGSKSENIKKSSRNKNFKDMSMQELIKYVQQYKKPDETINSILNDGEIYKGKDIEAPESDKNDNFYIVVVSDSKTASDGYYINLNNNNLYDRVWKKVN